VKKIWPKIALLVLCCAALAFELWHFRSSPKSASTPNMQRNKPDFVLLPVREVATFAGSMRRPKPRIESWEPTLGDINDLESNLQQISTLSEEFHDPNRRIDDARQYYRQYLAVEMNGKNVIFVNALCRIDPGDSNDWRKHLIDTVDGGKCYWRAFYDPSTHAFANLIVNGLG
jgi:hypothetical protein